MIEPPIGLFRQSRPNTAAAGSILAIIGLLPFALATYGQNPPDGDQPDAADPAGLHELYFGSHLPEDRAVARTLERAEELLHRERFSEAIPLLDGLLTAENDTFIKQPSVSNNTLPISVKSRVRTLLSDLPPPGREAYTLLFEAEAARQVKTALDQHDSTALARAAARFADLPAADEATLILSQMAADCGDFDTAAHLIGRLLASPTARERWGDYLPLRAAELAARRDKRAASDAYLAESSLRGDAASELRRVLTNSPALPFDHAADRNSLAPAGAPHLWERWQARVVVDRRLESQLGARRDRRRDSITSAPLLPSAIAVGDLVVARSLNNLVAIEWSTGKRVWETRPEADAWLDAGEEYVAAFSDDESGRGRLHPLLLRLWKDAVFASLSSDGERVFAIRDLDYATAAYSTRWGMLPGFPDGADRKSKLTNRLAAYRIDAEGKLAWEIDGAKPNHSLRGAFFLGAPLALSGSLFVIAEIDSEICLLELAPSDGRLLWRQPLATLERGVDQDSSRRLAGAVPSYRNGVLVCPTGAGVVVAIDPFAHALKWSFRVPVHKDLIEQQEDLMQRRAYGSFRLLSDQWLDNKAVLSDSEVVITLPESPDLHCLRLTTGEPLWSCPREDAYYLAGLWQSQAVVVGKREVISLALGDGEVMWRSAYPEGLVPNGRSLLCGPVLCLPLDKGHISVIELADGRQSQLLKTHTGQAVGNLISHRGSIVSQSLAHVDRFDRRQELEREVQERLIASADDATALRLAGELAETAGQPAEALQLFKRSHSADGQDPLIRERVVDALLTAITSDFAAHRADLPLLESLANDSQLMLKVLQLKADGLYAAGDLRDSLRCFLQIYEAAIEHDEAIVETTYGAARIDRWFNGGIQRLWQSADEDLRREISQGIALLRPPLDATELGASLGPLDRFVRYFGGVPGQEAAQLALADAHHSANRRREAEIGLLQLVVGDNAQISRDAQARLMQDPREESLETLPPTGTMASSNASSAATEFWPPVRIDAEVNRKGRRHGSRGRSDEEGPIYTPVRFQTVLMSQLGPTTFTLAAGGTEVVAWDAEGDAVIRGGLGPRAEQRQLNPRGEMLRGGRLGHFAYLSLGEQTFAIDAFAENTDETLQMWTRPSGASPNQLTLNRGFTRQEFNPRETKLLVATPNGIVLHARDAVYCVHPITGEFLWCRRGFYSDSEAFSDSKRLFLLSEDRLQGQIVAIADGAELGSWQPPPGSWIDSAGRRLVTEQSTETGVLLQVVDLATGAAEVQLEMPRGTKLVSFDPGWVAALSPLGQLEVIDANAGKIAFSPKLQDEPHLDSLQVFRAGEQLFVLTNILNDADQSVAGYVAPPGLSPATGHLYALDAETGSHLWPRPVHLTGRVLLPLQPPASPALMLTSYRMSPESDEGEALIELLAVDKRTGQSLFRSEAFPHAAQDQIMIRLDRRPEVVVHVDSRLWEVRLRPTAAARPPEPVADDEVESIATQDKDGLWGVGRQLGRILEGVLPGPPER